MESRLRSHDLQAVWRENETGNTGQAPRAEMGARMTVERGAALVGVLAVAGLVGYGSYRARVSLEARPSPEGALTEASSRPRADAEAVEFPVVRAPRNLFRPLQLEAPRSKEPTAAAPPPTNAPVSGAWYPPYTMPYIPPAYGSGFVPASGLPRSDGGEAPPGEPAKAASAPERAQPPQPDAAQIAVTALSTGPSGVRVLVEDLETHRSQWVSSGGTAFGYTLERATTKGGLFSKGGRYYAVGLGDGKSGKPVPSAAPPAPSAGGSSTPGAPTAASPTGGAPAAVTP